MNNVSLLAIIYYFATDLRLCYFHYRSGHMTVLLLQSDKPVFRVVHMTVSTDVLHGGHCFARTTD